MIIIERILFLKRISIFSSLSSYELRKIAEVVAEEEFEPGEIIFSEGEFGESMYLVVDGKISIFTGRAPAIKVLASFDKGNFFGEMGLYDDKPRAAAAIADNHSRTLVLRKGEFCDLISEFPMVALGIMKELNNRIRATNKKLDLIEKNIVDSTSRLYSREYFIDCMKSMLNRAGNEKATVGFLLIRLKKIHFNEGEGSATELEKFKADLIRELGLRLESFIRESDMLCRFDDCSILLMIPEFNARSTLMFQARITDDLNRVLIDFETGRRLYADLEFRPLVFPEDAANAELIIKTFETT
ncbi:MAG TPA: cyclic nucleotide-binding domain-containing protein [Candidatus Rifleibacterium sp.]|nr:cyclic nucleotide-binding domain-containing protein [Candidatus Rifleibacterium sp.]HPT45520.1 cyclic nucleotide-binding domain-containing protein [Candidatus Rifleibacterium sp.]